MTVFNTSILRVGSRSTGESDNIAIKDLVPILTFIAQSTGQERNEQGGIRDAFAQLLGTVPYPPALVPERLEKQEGHKEFASWGYTWLLLLGWSLVPIDIYTVQESAWEAPAPSQSNSTPVSSASFSHLLLGAAKSSPRGRKGQIFPSFGLGTFLT